MGPDDCIYWLSYVIYSLLFCLSRCSFLVDYILMDPSERQRLSISSIPMPFPRRVIRAPVPWATSYTEAQMWQSQHLFTTSPVMILLQDVWLKR